jgi:hypothetical protein
MGFERSVIAESIDERLNCLDCQFVLGGEFRRRLSFAQGEGLQAVLVEAEVIPLVLQEPGMSEAQTLGPDLADLRTSSQSSGEPVYQ